jgi:branched-chain amino acid transport system permease protein
VATTLERPGTGPDPGEGSPETAGQGPPGRHRPAARWNRPSVGGWAVRAAVVAGLALIGYLYITGTQQFRSDNLAAGVVVAIGALSLNVLIGYAGQISLGHQAFIGIGAFTSGYIISKSHQSFYVALAVAAIVGGLQAGVLGLVALRVKGLYFALVTLAYGFVAEDSIFKIKSFTAGGAGRSAPRPGGFTTDRAFLMVCLIALAVILLVDWRLTASKAGRALQALRESPQVAANYGVNVRAYTLFAFTVAGVYAGVAGALFASRRTTVVAIDFQFATIALPYLIVTVVGGLRRRGGIVLFALLYELSAEYLPDLAKNLGIHSLQNNAGNYVSALGGVLAILTLIFQPDGLGTITAPIGRWLKGEPFSLHNGGGPGAEGVADARP